MRQQFIIRERLVGLNEYQNACRTNRYASAKLKREQQDIVLDAIYAAGLIPMIGKVDVSFLWVEPNNRRDHDNVAFGKKFILDALVEADILEDDSPRHVGDFTDRFLVSKNSPHIAVVLYGKGRNEANENR